MDNVQGPGCGVKDHSDECLCDVVIVTPTPINADALQNMWMKKELCQTKGYAVPWTDEKLVSFFSELLFVHDAWVMVDYVRSFRDQPDSPQHNGWQAIRQVLTMYLRQQPPPPLEMFLRMFDITCEELTTIMTSAKKQISWETMKLFEEMVIGRKHTLKEIERATGLSENTTRTLYKYWFDGAPPIATQTGLPRGFVSQEARRLSRQGMTPSDVSAKLKQDYGVTLAPYDVIRANKMKQSS